jgi:hypothetical protein
MRPQLLRGALVRVRATRWLWPGDVIAYARSDGALSVHRFLGYAWKNGALHAVTKADAGTAADALTPISSVLGRVSTRDEWGTRLSIGTTDRLSAARWFLSSAAHGVARRLGV